MKFLIILLGIFLPVINIDTSTKTEIVQKYSPKRIEHDLYSWSQSMAETFQLVHSKSYFPIAFQDSMIKALDAFVHNFDKNSQFLGPRDYKDLIKTTNGQFFGIGVILAPKKIDDEALLVLDTVPESPAHKKGLQQYDKILAIDGKPVSSLTIEDAVKKLKEDKRYSPVTINILRGPKNLLTVTLERDVVKEEHITCYYFQEKQIAYCKLSLFSQEVADQLKAVLQKIKLRNPAGIVLDLRNNAGGLLNAGVATASLFLPPNSLVVSMKDKNQKVIEKLYTKDNPTFTAHVPIMILVNNFTASSAEILAASLSIYSQDGTISPHVFILGTKTYGKGSVQEVIPLSNDCALKITTCLYYPPNNNSIERVGLEPDFVIEQKFPPSADIALLNKIYEKDSRKEAPPVQEKKPAEHEDDWKTQKINALKEDYQIQCALNFISMLNTARKINPKLVETHEDALNFLKKNFVVSDKITIEAL